MANPEHVEIVKQGAEAIDEWRRDHPLGRLELRSVDLREVGLRRADLSFADLNGADLGGADLHGANLRAADLKGADLRGANLSGANLSGANLREADLTLADLTLADLTLADLILTNLSGADVSFANLCGASLARANLGEATLFETVFGDTDLSGAEGLEAVVHRRPSVVDERTLRRSWPLPQAFLRGCGLSDEMITFVRATLGKAIEFYPCFISYSSKDQAFAERLHADLQDKGVRCWFAPEDMKIGDRTRLRIDESIRLHDKLLLILSEHSVASQWVEQEVETALGKERKAKEDGQERTVVLPIRVDDSVMGSAGGWAALIRNTRHIGDFRRWEEHGEYQQSFERLLRDLKSEGGEGEGA